MECSSDVDPNCVCAMQPFEMVCIAHSMSHIEFSLRGAVVYSSGDFVSKLGQTYERCVGVCVLKDMRTRGVQKR